MGLIPPPPPLLVIPDIPETTANQDQLRKDHISPLLKPPHPSALFVRL